MRQLKMPSSLFLLLVAASFPAFAQDINAVQKKLESRYALTHPTADSTDIVTAGAVLVLQKEKLKMVGISNATPYATTYKDGKLNLGGGAKTAETLKKLCKFCPGGASSAAPSAPTRDFVVNEKIWVTKIEVKSDSIVFYLLSDAYGDTRYKATVAFPFAKGVAPSPDDALKLVSEVFTVDSASDQSGNGQDQQAPASGGQQVSSSGPSQPEPPAVIPPPPPPPPDAPAAAPKTTTIGQSTDEVVASLGQPDNIVNKGKTQVYFYKKLDLKVTFVGGKVTDIQ